MANEMFAMAKSLSKTVDPISPEMCAGLRDVKSRRHLIHTFVVNTWTISTQSGFRIISMLNLMCGWELWLWDEKDWKLQQTCDGETSRNGDSWTCAWRARNSGRRPGERNFNRTPARGRNLTHSAPHLRTRGDTLPEPSRTLDCFIPCVSVSNGI